MFRPSNRLFVIGLIIIIAISCSKETAEKPVLSKIAFGSCANQWANDDWGIFNTIVSKKPDIYLALGDNMYSDVVELADLPTYSRLIELGYSLLATKEPFNKLRAAVPVLATWDDHDYGYNNGGKEFPHKETAKKLFMKFWKIPADAPMREREGIYQSHYFGDGDHKVQIILLDMRSFLDVISSEPVTPTNDVSKSMLGDVQWQWLEGELKQPAKVRIIASSTQFCTQENGWETWANYPHEMARFFNHIQSTRAEGVFFVSGDVHYAEISKREVAGLYPIYDVTSSGLTHKEDGPRANAYRVKDAFADLNFGMIQINWNEQPVTISQEIYNKKGELQLQNIVSLDDMKF